MKQIQLFFLFLFFSLQLLSQKKEVYFQNIIDTTTNKKLKLAALDSLTYNFRNQRDVNLFADRLEQFVDLAIELEKYDEAIEFTIRGFSNISNKLQQKKRALQLIEKVEKFKNKTSDSYLLGGIYLKKAASYASTKEYKKAIENYTIAINNYSDKDSVYKADAFYFRGNQKFFNGLYVDAINDYQIASRYYDNLNDKQYYFYTLGSIISVYGVNGFDKKTIEQRKQLIKEKIAHNFTTGLYIEYYNQSLNYKKLDSVKQQEESLLTAYKYLQKHIKEARLHHKITLVSSLSSFYSEKNQLKKAKIYLDEAYAYYIKHNKSDSPADEFLRAKSRYLFKKGDNTTAISYAKQSLTVAKNNGLATSLMHSNKLLADIYETNANTSKSLEYYKKYTKTKDSIFSVAKTNAFTYYQTLYETEKKEREINSQKASIDLLAKENEAKKRFLIFGGIAAFLSFVIFVLFRNRIQLKKKKELQEQFSQELLVTQELERKRISKDLHDSLGQSLLLIKNKVSLKSDKKTQELINNAIEEMRSISRILHPFQLEDIGVSKALENLIIQLNENYKDIFIFGDIDDIKSELNQSQEVNLFRIVQECLSNIIKHAKAKSAKVTLLNKPNYISVSIKDNGIGFDFSEKYNDFKSMGLKTIKERVKYLNGTIKIDSVKNRGTTFTIQFPKT